MANAVATTQERAGNLVAYFEKNADKFSAYMPEKQVPKFMRTMNNAILRDPKIAEASTTSVFLECQKCANDGLVLDGREAALVTFKTNRREKKGNQWVDNWQTEVVYIPMIKGLAKLINSSPEILGWHTGLVYENEFKEGRFKYEAGDTPRVFHEPIIVGARGPVVAAYSVARLRNGTVSVEVMTREQLDRIKNRTKSKRKKKVGNNEVFEITGPWADDEEEMQRKTVARRHFKNLPLEGKAAEAVNRVDGLYDYQPGTGDDTAEIAPPPKVKAITNKKTTSAAEKLAAAAKNDKPEEPEEDQTDQDDGDVIDHDPETGELKDEGENPPANPDDDF